LSRDILFNWIKFYSKIRKLNINALICKRSGISSYLKGIKSYHFVLQYHVLYLALIVVLFILLV